MVASLLVSAYHALKNFDERFYAIDVVTQDVNLFDKCKQLLAEITLNTTISLNSCDQIGVNMFITLGKKSGYIKLVLHKKRVCDFTCMFVVNNAIIQTLTYIKYISFDDILKHNYIQIVLKDCHQVFINYINNGMSRKWKALSHLAQFMLKQHTKKKKFMIDIRTSPHVYFDKTWNVWLYHYGKYICIDTT